VGPRAGLGAVEKRKIFHCRESKLDYNQNWPVESYEESHEKVIIVRCPEMCSTLDRASLRHIQD
jgi:hypothetical protein